MATTKESILNTENTPAAPSAPTTGVTPQPAASTSSPTSQWDWNAGTWDQGEQKTEVPYAPGKEPEKPAPTSPVDTMPKPEEPVDTPTWDWNAGEWKRGEPISNDQDDGEKPAAATKPAETSGEGEQKRMSYVQMYQELNPFKPPTEEELKKERRKQKREQIFAAIGDGISALSNLFFTTRGAPNMYNYQAKNQSQTVQDRWDKLKAEREANTKEYNNGLLKAQMADDEANDRDRKWQRQLGIDKATAAEKAKKQERDDALAEAKRGLLAAQASKNSAQAAYWAAKQEALENGDPLDVALKKAKIAKTNAEAARARRQGTSSWVSGGSGSGNFHAYDAEGNTHYFKSAEEAKRFALENGTWEDHEVTTTTEKNSLTGTTSTTTTRPSGGHSKKPKTKKKTTGVNW